MRYGVVGLGNLGAHLAASLLRAGFTVAVTDLDRGTARELESAGAVWAEDARGVAAVSDAVITCLPSPAVSERVLGELLQVLPAGATWIEMSTLGRDEILRLAAVAGRAGAAAGAGAPTGRPGFFGICLRSCSGAPQDAQVSSWRPLSRTNAARVPQ